jgi:hypothetical protein
MTQPSDPLTALPRYFLGAWYLGVHTRSGAAHGSDNVAREGDFREGVGGVRGVDQGVGRRAM